MVVYITAQNAKVFREGHHLVVRHPDQPDQPILLHQTKQMVVCGNVTLTQPALALLLQEEIDTVWLRTDGRYLGRLEPPRTKNIELRICQFDRLRDTDFTLAVARAVVRGKLHNMADLLRKVARARSAEPAAAAARELRKMTRLTDQVESVPKLFGHEGQAATLYFKAMRLGFIHDHGFRKRIRRPPTDPVNVVLSLLYTFLTNHAHAALRLAHLDPQPGFLHAPHYGRNSLPLDLMEEFRPLVVDSLTISLFNLKVVGAKDFDHQEIKNHPSPIQNLDNLIDSACHDDLDVSEPAPGHVSEETSEEKYPLRLTRPAFRRLLQAFEKKMLSPCRHCSSEKEMTYGQALIRQARQLRRVIEGEENEYRPLVTGS